MRKGESTGATCSVVEFDHEYYGRRRLLCEGAPDLLFTENETNTRRLYGDAKARGMSKTVSTITSCTATSQP